MVKSLNAVTVVSVTLALSAPIIAQGIPDRVQALEEAVTALQTDVKTLQGANSTLQTQINGLQGQVSGLQNRVSVLESSNTTVQTKIGTIQSQVGTLQSQQMVLSATVSGLQAQGQVYVARPPKSALLHSGSFSTVGGLDLPAGSYLIHAIVPTANFDTDDQTGECFLSTVQGGGGVGASGEPGLAGDAVERIKGTGILNRETWFTQIP